MSVVKLKRSDLIYPELCYQIIGILFDVWTRVGHGHRERFYQKAIADGLKASGFSFREQVPVELSYHNQIIGSYYLDFLVESKIVLEVKVREYFSRRDIEQLYAYLRAGEFKLGLIAHFTRTGVKFKRIVNIH